MILARSSELDSGEMPKGKVVSKFLIKVGQLALYASKTDSIFHPLILES